jgi:replicative DNA helicase|tara:strand:+ start:4355 stop:5842 length:1488 start_codon:yes stop_codon:yes gene_type:complete
MQIYSLNVEKHVLSGLIKYPNLFADVERFVGEKDFYNEVHRTIFCVIRSILLNRGELDKVLLAEKIKNLGVSFKDDIDIYNYIDNLDFSQIKPPAIIEASRELLKLRIRREIQEAAKEVQALVEKSANKDIDEIIGEADSLYNSKINGYSLQDEPINIFDDLVDLVEEKGNEPNEDIGLTTPFEEFNRMYGGLRSGNLYAVVARPGQGKTTWINNLAMKTGEMNDVPVLMLDTEMATLDIQFRTASSITDVPMWFLETGNWRKNGELVKKVRSGLSKVKPTLKCYHAFVGNKSIDQICSMVRRWYLSSVGRGNKCIITYDYIKLTGEKVGQNWAEHQAIGDKIDKLKKLAEEIKAPLITAMQLNRSGENFNRRGTDITDDSSAISLSDRLQWFASFVAIFRRKTLDEMADDGENFGTHKLVPLKTRFQGKDAAGHHDLIRRPMEDGTLKWMNNFLNFSVNNFNVEEQGSLHSIIEAQQERFNPQDSNPLDGEDLL